MPQIHTIDAEGKRLGRVASEAAKFLMGKNTPSFRKNVLPDVSVEIINAAKSDVPFKKMMEKKYERYSGYPGGIKFSTLDDLMKKKGWTEVYRFAVYGMLPTNKLRSQMIKRLTIKE